jgi:hypothetical protein
MAMRDTHFQPGHKFGEMLRGVRAKKAAAHSDRTMRGEAVPKTGMEGMEQEERGGSAGNRPGKKPQGKFRRIEIEPKHTVVDGRKQVTHVVRVHHHQAKHKGNGPMPPYKEPTEHLHTSLEHAKQHVAGLMDNLEPEESAPDSSDMAASIY